MQQQNMMQSSQQQQAMRPQPPSVLSTKDHLYVRDMLSWNLLAMKKAHFYVQHCQVPEIKSEIEKVGQMHERHYNQILRCLQNPNQPSTQQTQQPMQ